MEVTYDRGHRDIKTKVYKLRKNITAYLRIALFYRLSFMAVQHIENNAHSRLP